MRERGGGREREGERGRERASTDYVPAVIASAIRHLSCGVSSEKQAFWAVCHASVHRLEVCY